MFIFLVLSISCLAQEFEYKILHVKIDNRKEYESGNSIRMPIIDRHKLIKIQDELNILGKNKWELISISPIVKSVANNTVTEGFILFLKRDKTEENRCLKSNKTIN